MRICHVAVTRHASTPSPRSASRDVCIGSSGCEAPDHTRFCTGGHDDDAHHAHRTRSPDRDITQNDRDTPSWELADAELHFSSGRLVGLKFVGFAVWERRIAGGRPSIPARPHTANAEGRRCALLRAAMETASQDSVRDLILRASADDERTGADA
jgi:hypothetical protein